MDLKAISSSLKDTSELEIFHPLTGEGGLFFELAAPHHSASQAKINVILDNIKRRPGPSTSSQEERDGAELLAARIVGWRGMSDDGKEVPYDEELCINLMRDRRSFWIRKQVVTGLGDDTRPFKR